MRDTLERFICILVTVLFAAIIPFSLHRATLKLTTDSAKEYEADEFAWRLGCDGKVFLSSIDRDFDYEVYDENGVECAERVVIDNYCIDFSACRYVKVWYGDCVRYIRIR